MATFLTGFCALHPHSGERAARSVDLIGNGCEVPVEDQKEEKREGLMAIKMTDRATNGAARKAYRFHG